MHTNILLVGAIQLLYLCSLSSSFVDVVVSRPIIGLQQQHVAQHHHHRRRRRRYGTSAGIMSIIPSSLLLTRCSVTRRSALRLCSLRLVAVEKEQYDSDESSCSSCSSCSSSNGKIKKRKGIIGRIFRRKLMDETSSSSNSTSSSSIRTDEKKDAISEEEVNDDIEVSIDESSASGEESTDESERILLCESIESTNKNSTSTTSIDSASQEDAASTIDEDIETSKVISEQPDKNITDNIPANTHLVGMPLNNDDSIYAKDATSVELMDEIDEINLVLDSVKDETKDDEERQKGKLIISKKRKLWPFGRKELIEKVSIIQDTKPSQDGKLRSVSKRTNESKRKQKSSTALVSAPVRRQNNSRKKVARHEKENKKKVNLIHEILRRISPFSFKGMTKYLSLATLLLLFAPIPKRFSVGNDGDKYYASNLAQSSIPFREPSYQSKHTYEDHGTFGEPEKENSSTQAPILITKSNNIETDNDILPEASTSTPETVAAKIQETFQDTYKKINNFEEDRRRASSSVAVAVRKVGPSVVRIDTKRFLNAGRGSPYSSPLGGLFDDFDPHEENGQGSGIIFSAKGLILTNAHVVNRADEVMVTLTDGRRYKAGVKGTDELTDLAVLQIQSFSDSSQSSSESLAEKPKAKAELRDKWLGDPLPVATLGNSDHVEVGEYVIAVGNPVGLDNTVTMGIVSAIKRSSEEVGIPNKKVPFIQTDAAINPGNSGGPLVNGHGEIIGINTCIRANAEGIGFAIPINKAKSIIYRLADGQTIQHGFVGMNVISITPDLARQQNADPNSPAGMIPEVYGAMITMVRANAPAATHGLRRFDVVLEIGGISVKNAGDVIKVFDEAPVGKEIDVKVLRNNRELTISVIPDDLTKKILEARQSQEKQLNDAPRQGDGSTPRIFILPFQ